MNILKKLCVATILASAMALTTAAPLSTSSEKVVLSVKQVVGKDGVVSLSTEVGPLVSKGGEYVIYAASKPAGTIVNTMSPISFNSNWGTSTGRPTQGQALDRANMHIRATMSGMSSSLAQYMKAAGVSSGWYNFKQEVEIDADGEIETWTVYWNHFVDVTGRGAFADAMLVPPDPKLLYVVYTPLATDKDLPAGWQYPDGAGTLKYQVRNLDFAPLSAWVTVNVGGAFDAPQQDDASQEAGVDCLMDSARAGCSFRPEDVKQLLDRTGAVGAVVDYTRRVEPVWEEQPDGTLTPKMSMSVDLREVEYQGCSKPTYRNTGSFGYTLAANVDRYFGSANGTPRVIQYSRINSFTGSYVSPTVPYAWTVTVPRNTATLLPNYAIDPVKGNELMLTSALPGLSYLAPVTTIGEESKVVGTFNSGMYWYGGRSDDHYVAYQAKCGPAGVEVETGMWTRHNKSGGPWIFSGWQKTILPENSWAPVGLYQHGSSRFMGYGDIEGGTIRLSDNASTTCYAWRCGDGYGEAHNANAMTTVNDAIAGWSIKWECGTASEPYYLESEQYAFRRTANQCVGKEYFGGWYISGGVIMNRYATMVIDPTTKYTCSPRSDATGVDCADLRSKEGDIIR